MLKVCCAVTMDPDDVLVLIDKLKENIEKIMIKEIISSKDLQTAINGLSQVINNYCKHEGGGIVFICVL